MVHVIVTVVMIALKIVLKHGVVVQKYLITTQMQMVMVLDQEIHMRSVMQQFHQVLY